LIRSREGNANSFFRTEGKKRRVKKGYRELRGRGWRDAMAVDAFGKYGNL